MGGRYDAYTAVIIGGEVTVNLPSGAGEGGRNQQYAAVTLRAFKGYPKKWLAVSVGTDGSDYIPQVAGALVDSTTSQEIRIHKIELEDYIRRYDAFTLFKKLGSSLVLTGNTGTNVADIILYLLDQ
jgi:hydroxypyruvate reductase/glycerate 2-kinase